jgi:hypothetical protein
MAFWKASSVLEQDSFLGNVAGQVHSAMPRSLDTRYRVAALSNVASMPYRLPPFAARFVGREPQPQPLPTVRLPLISGCIVQ